MSTLSLLGLVCLGFLAHQAVSPARAIRHHRRLILVSACILLVGLMPVHPFLAPVVAIIGLLAGGPRQRPETPGDGPEPTEGTPASEVDRLRDEAYDGVAGLMTREGERVRERVILIEQELRAADEGVETDQRIAGYRQVLQMIRAASSASRSAD